MKGKNQKVSHFITTFSPVVIYFKKKKNQKMYIGSILSRKKLSLAIKGCDFVYHFAALSELDVATTRPVETAKINILGTLNALILCKK